MSRAAFRTLGAALLCLASMAGATQAQMGGGHMGGMGQDGMARMHDMMMQRMHDAMQRSHEMAQCQQQQMQDQQCQMMREGVMRHMENCPSSVHDPIRPSVGRPGTSSEQPPAGRSGIRVPSPRP